MESTNAVGDKLPSSCIRCVAEPDANLLSCNKTFSKLTLRPYQIETLNQATETYKEGKNRLLVSLPTGTGKTIIFAHLVASTLGRSLVITHRDELLEQAFNKIKMVLPSADIGIVKAQRNEIHNQIIIASIQTLTRESRLAQLNKDFSTIIIDEAHHCSSLSYKKVLHSLGSFNTKDAPLTLGVTATPERGDKVGLDSVFQEIVYHRGLMEMIGEQYLSDLTWQDVNLDIDLDSIETRAGDFIEAELIKALTNSNTPRQILYAFQQYASNRKTLIFVPGVTLSRSIATLFKEYNIACESIDGKLSPKERKEILNRLHNGKTQVVVNCMLLTEGFDEPSIDCILFARPTKSKSFYLQMLGRGTRLHPNKKDCLVIDLVGLSKRHNLITLPTLLGISSTKFKKKSLLSITEELALELETQQTQSQTLDLIAEQQKAIEESQKQLSQTQTREIIKNNSLSDSDLPATETKRKTIKKTIRFNWLKLSEKCYALSIGGNALLFLISEDKMNWSVIWREENKTNLVAKELTLEYAMGLAQDFVRNLGVSSLIDIDADWRSQKPSEKQLDLLNGLNISFPNNITKGLASDLIAIHFGKLELTNYQQTLSQSNSNFQDISNNLEIITSGNQNNSSNFSTSFEANNFSKHNATPNNQIGTQINNQVNSSTIDNVKIVYKPTFAKNSFPPLPANYAKYEQFRLNNYKAQGDVTSQTNRSQSLALTLCKEYVNNFFNQEIGMIISGESQVGKTHLAVSILNELTNQFGVSTLFCDYRLLLKNMQETSYSYVLNELFSKIAESQVFLLDGFVAKNNSSKTVRNLMFRIINYCCRNNYGDKRLIITTRHHNYSSIYHQVESFRLSLGDILGIDVSTRLYQYCHYLEIASLNDLSSTRNKFSSDFVSIFDTANNIVNELTLKKAG